MKLIAVARALLFFCTLIQLVENLDLSTEFHQCAGSRQSEMLMPNVSYTIVSIRFENFLFHT